MDWQRFAVPVIALTVAGISAFAANKFIKANNQPVVAIAAPAPEIEYKEILVAANVINPGSFLGPSSFRWQKWPDVDVPETYFVKGSADMSLVDGAVARQPVLVGDPILTGSFVRPGDRGFLAAVLDTNMRAISVPVDEASSNAGLIQPGDRVDLILTQTIAEEGDLGSSRHASETVVEDLRVIAMGRSLQSIETETGDTQRQVRTATLEVTPENAEKVALVTEIGKLSLSLRSLAEDVDKELAASAVRQPYTWDSDVSSIRQTNSVKVFRGSSTEALDISNGGQ